MAIRPVLLSSWLELESSFFYFVVGGAWLFLPGYLSELASATRHLPGRYMSFCCNDVATQGPQRPGTAVSCRRHLQEGPPHRQGRCSARVPKMAPAACPTGTLVRQKHLQFDSRSEPDIPTFHDALARPSVLGIASWCTACRSFWASLSHHLDLPKVDRGIAMPTTSSKPHQPPQQNLPQR